LYAKVQLLLPRSVTVLTMPCLLYANADRSNVLAVSLPTSFGFLYCRISTVRPSASVIVVVAVPPFGGVTLTFSPAYVVCVRHCSSPPSMKMASVSRPAPSYTFWVVAGSSGRPSGVTSVVLGAAFVES
jgi:hypothetical protein